MTDTWEFSKLTIIIKLLFQIVDGFFELFPFECHLIYYYGL